MEPAMGRLSTHVLDAHSGRPADGVAIELVALENGAERLVKRARTNADGRTDEPLISGALPRGVFELRFHVGDYFRARGVALAEPAFLDVAVVRFGLAETDGHYHVPLLASPWSYSTYRGS
jgi:hydroxyisourate hydrolase